MGITPVEDKYDTVILFYDKTGEEHHLFFDGDYIKKVISFTNNDSLISMHEYDVNYKTAENRTVLLPKTNRGKPKKLNISAIHAFNGNGTYFYYKCVFKDKKASIVIANYDNQRTFYDNANIKNCDSFEKLIAWCEDFANDSTSEEIIEAQQFSELKRSNIKYNEGDYFRVKIGRRKYTYGRILFDICKRTKQGVRYWDVLMGRPLIVESFHILTERKDMSVDELKDLPTFPSCFMMDNAVFYGDYEIIGNGELPENPRYPIMYGRDIHGLNSDKIIFQCGEIHEELPYSKEALIVPFPPEFDHPLLSSLNSSFINNRSGWSVLDNEEVIERCIKEKSNDYYWKYFKHFGDCDLRSPQNAKKLKDVLNQVNHSELLFIYSNY